MNTRSLRDHTRNADRIVSAMGGLLQASSSVPRASLNLLVKLAAAVLRVSWVSASAASVRRQALASRRRPFGQ